VRPCHSSCFDCETDSLPTTEQYHITVDVSDALDTALLTWDEEKFVGASARAGSRDCVSGIYRAPRFTEASVRWQQMKRMFRDRTVGSPAYKDAVHDEGMITEQQQQQQQQQRVLRDVRWMHLTMRFDIRESYDPVPEADAVSLSLKDAAASPDPDM